MNMEGVEIIPVDMEGLETFAEDMEDVETLLEDMEGVETIREDMEVEYFKVTQNQRYPLFEPYLDDDL